MKKQIAFEIECEENHCFYAPGESCEYCRPVWFQMHCQLFNKELSEDHENRVLRCVECKERAK